MISPGVFREGKEGDREIQRYRGREKGDIERERVKGMEAPLQGLRGRAQSSPHDCSGLMQFFESGKRGHGSAVPQYRQEPHCIVMEHYGDEGEMAGLPASSSLSLLAGCCTRCTIVV